MVMPPDREDRDRSIGGSMDWQILNIVSEALSPTALMDFKDWFPEFSGMAQSVLIFLLVLTFGAMMLECFSGFRLGALERFLVGFGPGSVISLMILTVSYEYEEQDALLYALAIGAIFGVLNVLLNRVFLFAAGFVAGNALIRYLAQHDIFVRETSQSPSVQDCFRITCGTVPQMRRVAAVIDDYYAGK